MPFFGWWSPLENACNRGEAAPFCWTSPAKLLPQQQQAQPKGPAFFFCTGRHGRRAGERKRREALGMGSKSSKVSNVHNDEAGSGGGKTSGSVIDKLTEAQLDEFREAFNSFDKVRSAPG